MIECKLSLPMKADNFLFVADEMNQANEELRGIIKNMWPSLSPKMIDLLVPPNSELVYPNLSTGKIYAGLLLHEIYKENKAKLEKAQEHHKEVILKTVFPNF